MLLPLFLTSLALAEYKHSHHRCERPRARRSAGALLTPKHRSLQRGGEGDPWWLFFSQRSFSYIKVKTDSFRNAVWICCNSLRRTKGTCWVLSICSHNVYARRTGHVIQSHCFTESRIKIAGKSSSTMHRLVHP